MPQPPVLVCLDIPALVVRAVAATREMPRDDRERRTEVLVGVLATVAAAVERIGAELGPVRGLLAAFDAPPLWRAERFPDYKAHRPSSAERTTQTDHLRAMLGLAGVRIGRQAGFEADDVLASAARAAHRESWRAVIVSNDRDLFASVAEDVSLLHLTASVERSLLLDPVTLSSKVGVPAQEILTRSSTVSDAVSWYAFLNALRGDPSDNVPGVPGVGEVRAAKITSAFQNTNDLADRRSAWHVAVPASSHSVLDEHLPRVGFNEQLLSLDTSLGFGPSACPLPPPGGWAHALDSRRADALVPTLERLLTARRSPGR